MTVIDGATNSTANVVVGSGATAIATNPITNKTYVANAGGNNVTVIDGATNSTSTVAAGSVPNFVAVDPTPTNREFYVDNLAGGTVTVIDGATSSTATVTVGSFPVFADRQSGDQQNLRGQQRQQQRDRDRRGHQRNLNEVAAGTAPFAVAVNPVTNQIYVTNDASNNVTVIDGASNFKLPP